MKKILFLFSFSFVCQCCLAQHWQILGMGLNGNVTKLFVDSISNKLYVAGPFTIVNNDTIWGIASWNGNNWDSLGHGIDRHPNGPFPAGNTWGITQMGGNLYTGGNFGWTGNAPSKYFSIWDGVNWNSILGGQPNEVVDDIITYNNELYISGVFDSVGTVAAHGIAKWNGLNWQAIGSNYDFNSPCCGIYKMAFYNGNLYVGGFFKDLSGNPCRLAKWNGTNWQFLTNSLQGGIADVWDLQVFNNELYVSGLFYTSDGNAGNSIMRWNDTIWRNVGGGVQIVLNPSPKICDMCAYNGKLYCVGNFEKIGGILANGVAEWDGTQWCGFGTAFDNDVNQIAFYNDTMYVAGSFSTVDALNIEYIAKWIGGNYVDTCGVINTGITEPTQQTLSVKVFPNPITTNATFQITGMQGNKTLIIYDQLGKEIWRKETIENQIDFQTKDFASGLYFYHIEQKNGEIISGKFIIQ